jgi:hypothetical protein
MHGPGAHPMGGRNAARLPVGSAGDAPTARNDGVRAQVRPWFIGEISVCSYCSILYSIHPYSHCIA